MSQAALNAALALCLGAGTVDLLALNLVVLPAARGPLAQPIAPEITAARAAQPAALSPLHAELAGLLPVPLARGPAPRPEPVVILEFGLASPHMDRRGARRLSQTLGKLRDASEIVVVGHADASGPEQLNDRLSAQRAAAVARRLLGKGIASARVRIDARGEREPRPAGNSRRVEIFVGGR